MITDLSGILVKEPRTNDWSNMYVQKKVNSYSNKTGDHALVGPISYVNHSHAPNAIYLALGKKLVLKIVRNIDNGNELYTNYGNMGMLLHIFFFVFFVKDKLKGSVTRFSISVFFNEATQSGPLIHGLKHFCI